MRWQNIEAKQEEFTLKAYDIELKKENGLAIQEQTNKGELKYEKDVVVKKVYKIFSESYYDKRKLTDDTETNVWCADNGYIYQAKKHTVNAFFNKNIVGYLITKSFGVNKKTHVNLIRHTTYHGHGFYLRSDNYIEKLPLFCAKLYPQENWYERDVYFTTADGGFEYTKDKDFLKNCFIFTCLSQSNKCISFTGSDGRFYRNELCFDNETLASEHLKTVKLNEEDEKLLDLWDEILEEAKQTNEYKKSLKYGTYQIIQELNTFYKDEKDRKIFNYPILNTKINSLKIQLKEYYKIQIQDKLFQYQLLK